MMGNADMLDAIRELNLSYMLLAQRLLNEDREVARFRLGVSAEVAEVLGKLSLAQTVKLASSASMLCSFRMDDRALLSTLADKMPLGAFASAHASILLASQASSEALAA